jgi:hypothetical protein
MTPCRRPRPACLCFRLAAALLALSGPAAGSDPLPDFFRDLIVEFREEYAAHRGPEFLALCAETGLDPSEDANRETWYRVRFLHDLLTTTRASDCARGGILGIPYFWHWIEPNPRHDILALPGREPLVSQPPPASYRRYATRADIDRVPALYLGDLVSEEPGYAHPDCGSFHTFGWCSEREMAYTALMTAWGRQAKVVQSGIHTWSEVWCPFRGAGGKTIVLSALVDNTFDSVKWEAVPAGTKLEAWLNDTGSGAQIDWYNRMARSREQIEALAGTPVGTGASNRIRSLVGRALEHARRDGGGNR